MKANEAMIAWTPAWEHHADNPTKGKVEVGPWPDRTGWSDRYSMTVGACLMERHKAPEWQQIAMVFIDFHSVVVGYGIDPQEAHTAFLAIDEYRQRIAPDIPGAD